MTERKAGEVCPMLARAMSHLSGLGTCRGALAAGEDTGGFRLKEHYKQPKAKAAFFSLK